MQFNCSKYGRKVKDFIQFYEKQGKLFTDIIL